MSPQPLDAWVYTASILGKQAARDAASWITDGNEHDDSRRAKLKLMDDGDPAMDAIMPARPSLSGEFVDGPDAERIIEEVTGMNATDVPHEDREAITNAWEEGVDEEFQTACEAELRRWVA